MMKVVLLNSLLVAFFSTTTIAMLSEALFRYAIPANDTGIQNKVLSTITIAATSSLGFLTTFFTTSSFKFSLVSALSILFCWALLLLNLKMKVASRRTAIRRDLPILLDYLVLQVESGHSLLSAIRSAPSLFTSSEPLSQGLTEIELNLKVGGTLQEALEKAITFLNCPEAEVPFQAISSALRHGTPMGSMLREQSFRMREHMILEGEQFANTASIKILIPLLFFIFPAAFLVIFSPVIVSLATTMP